MRKALKHARQNAIKCYSNALRELELFNTIPKDHFGRVYFYRMYEICSDRVLTDYNTIMKSRSTCKIYRIMENMNSYVAIWKLAYNYYRETMNERNN